MMIISIYFIRRLSIWSRHFTFHQKRYPSFRKFRKSLDYFLGSRYPFRRASKLLCRLIPHRLPNLLPSQKLCFPVHKNLLGNSGFLLFKKKELVICCGITVFEEIHEQLFCDCMVQLFPSGWGKTKIGKISIPSRKIVLGLPHLSTFKLLRNRLVVMRYLLSSLIPEMKSRLICL